MEPSSVQSGSILKPIQKLKKNFRWKGLVVKIGLRSRETSKRGDIFGLLLCSFQGQVQRWKKEDKMRVFAKLGQE